MNESRGVEDMGRYLTYAAASRNADNVQRVQGCQVWVQLDPDDQYGLPWRVCAAALEEKAS